MADPVLALILIVSFFAVVTAASYFKTLDGALWREARVPMIAGALSGVIIRFVTFVPPFVATGVVLTLAALYVRLTGRESEPADGMALGALTGAAASVPLILFSRNSELSRLSECILAGAVAGYGITFGLTHVREKIRQAAIDALTAAAAIGAAWLAILAAQKFSERDVAIAATAIVPLVLIAAVFAQWPTVRAELRDESNLGFIDHDDVRRTAHPFLRLGRGGWHDTEAHRQFVRIATKIALRKRQQRHRTEELARLYQLEVIKLRMELQEMTRIDRAMRVHAETA
jgi:hypothetical protein